MGYMDDQQTEPPAKPAAEQDQAITLPGPWDYERQNGLDVRRWAVEHAQQLTAGQYFDDADGRTAAVLKTARQLEAYVMGGNGANS